eukprot:scaffold6230_cov127-Isochrysis_galbana.AAC.11
MCSHVRAPPCRSRSPSSVLSTPQCTEASPGPPALAPCPRPTCRGSLRRHGPRWAAQIGAQRPTDEHGDAAGIRHIAAPIVAPYPPWRVQQDRASHRGLGAPRAIACPAEQQRRALSNQRVHNDEAGREQVAAVRPAAPEVLWQRKCRGGRRDT